MVPHKKFMFNGLAGLVLLVPVLCMFYLKDTWIDNKLLVTPIVIPDKNPQDVIDKNGRVIIISYKLLPRNFKDVHITGNMLNDEKQLQRGMDLVNTLADEDTVNGIRFCFDKNATYNEFVRALNICQKSTSGAYFLKDNYLYVFNYSKPKHKGTVIEDIPIISL